MAGEPTILPEGEFDALLLWQEAGDLVGVATSGAATGARVPRVLRLHSGSAMTEPDQLAIWDEAWRTVLPVGPFARRSLRRWFPLAGGTDLLELGCGGGTEACLFARHGYRVVATDFARSALEATRQCAERQALTVRVERVDLRTGILPFATASFDIVYAHLSLHYFDDVTTAALFGECQRVLHSEGVLCIRCKSVDDPLYGRGEAFGGHRFVLDGQVRHFFSRDYLRDLLAEWQVLALRRTRGLYGPRTMRSAFIEGVARPTCSRKQLRT